MSRRYIYFGSFASVQFFSDLFGMPAAIYSLRKLTPNATNCIRVRRSSDNTEQDIGFVANSPNSPIDTTALLSFVGAGNGFVTTFYDQSTNGKNGLQSTASEQHQIVNAGSVILLNTKPTLLSSISGSNKFPYIISNTTFITAFTLTRIVSPVTINYMLWNNSPQQGIWHGRLATDWGIGSTPDGSLARFLTPYDSNQVLGQFIMKSSSLFISKNGSAETNTGSANSSMTINEVGGRQSTAFTLAGNFQEIILYNSDKSTDRISIRDNINNYYNVF